MNSEAVPECSLQLSRLYRRRGKLCIAYDDCDRDEVIAAMSIYNIVEQEVELTEEEIMAMEAGIEMQAMEKRLCGGGAPYPCLTCIENRRL